MNRVREIREAKGITLKELSQKLNVMAFWLQRLEQYGWDKSPFGIGFDMKLAEVLGVHVTELFPEYAPPKREPEPQQVDNRTPEERERDFEAFKAHWRERQKPPNDEWTRCHFEQTQEGVFEGQGSFQCWEYLQKKR